MLKIRESFDWRSSFLDSRTMGKTQTMDIHCPNCNYEGSAIDARSMGLRYLAVGCLLILAAILPTTCTDFNGQPSDVTIMFPFFVVPFSLFAIFAGKRHICPTCRCNFPIPLAQHKRNKAQDTQPPTS